jgi:putative endopeptidase
MDAVDRALGEPMGHAYAERYLPAAAKDAAKRVADGVRNAAKNAIAHNAWMDEATRAAAQAKLDKLRTEIGESSRNPSVSGLALDSGNFASDMLAIAAWSHRRDMAAIGKRTNERRWPVLAQIPDVSYDLMQNRIVVTAAFLQPPAFDANADAAQQFGALGSLIGHQLHYAFDGKGRFIDADGRSRDWWSPAASNAYLQRTTPIIAQYDAYPAMGEIKVNGQRTRDENLADIAGVELALDAFHSAPGAQPEAKGAASPDRRFFEAYASVWQRSTAPDTATAEAGTSVQAPAKYRVDGVLANVPEFGKAFACKAGQPMDSKVPVTIWR